MKYLMWDVDGTLILSGGAGKDAMIKVIKDYYFLDAFDFTQSLAGRTDSDIVKGVVTRLRGRCNSAEAAGILIRYHMELPKQLPLHTGKVLKNVEKTLQYFSQPHSNYTNCLLTGNTSTQYFSQPHSNYTNCLLTGNTSTGARLKLQHFGLDSYFDYAHSVFGEISESREMLAQVALQRLYLQNETISPRDLIFIGDTPNDARCANAIGAPCVIVMAGSGYKREDFAAEQPWKIIDELPADPADFAKLLEEIDS